MKSKLISVFIVVADDIATNTLHIDAEVERERGFGRDCNFRTYNDISNSSLLRLQRLQNVLISRNRCRQKFDINELSAET